MSSGNLFCKPLIHTQNIMKAAKVKEPKPQGFNALQRRVGIPTADKLKFVVSCFGRNDAGNSSAFILRLHW